MSHPQDLAADKLLSPTIHALMKTRAISTEEVSAATEAILANPTAGVYPIAAGYVLDLAAAVRAHRPSAVALASPDDATGYKRTLARTAILLARPEKA